MRRLQAELDRVANETHRDTVLVLHMMGNHGPAYFRRYPPEFRRFTPDCATAELRDCTREQVINAYDNAILYTDHVLALLPFEPPYMEAAGMSCDFVGHPIAERAVVTAEERAAFRAAHGIAPGAPLFLIAPGSRKGEVARLMPLFLETGLRLRARYPDVRFVVPVAETVAVEVTAGLAPLAPVFVLPEAGEAEKHRAAAAATAALVASGTVTLEMAAAGTPHVAAYRAAPLTAMIVRRLIMLRGVHNYAPDDLAEAVAFLGRHHEDFPFQDLVRGSFDLDSVQCAFEHAVRTRSPRVAVVP